MISIKIEQTSDADQRIDKFIRKYLPNAPLGGIFKWLRTGKIKVNQKKVDQTYRLNQEDHIEFYFSPEEMKQFQESHASKLRIQKETLKQDLEVLYEDDVLLIINKPASLNVHPSDHKSNEASLIELVQDRLWSKYNSLSFKPSLVHRIDRDTTGCIMIAKEKGTLEKLLTLLQQGYIQKTYHAIILGAPKESRGTIDAKLLRVENAKAEAKVRVDSSGQTAVTHFRLLKTEICEKYSLLECQIETGRTHQIRVHLAHVWTPIIGDKAYGDKKENSFALREYGINRQLLHAFSLSFPHPVSKKQLTILAPYPEDMKHLVEPSK